MTNRNASNKSAERIVNTQVRPAGGYWMGRNFGMASGKSATVAAVGSRGGGGTQSLQNSVGTWT